jgi:hypothetical protein
MDESVLGHDRTLEIYRISMGHGPSFCGEGGGLLGLETRKYEKLHFKVRCKGVGITLISCGSEQGGET